MIPYFFIWQFGKNRDNQKQAEENMNEILLNNAKLR